MGCLARWELDHLCAPVLLKFRSLPTWACYSWLGTRSMTWGHGAKFFACECTQVRDIIGQTTTWWFLLWSALPFASFSWHDRQGHPLWKNNKWILAMIFFTYFRRIPWWWSTRLCPQSLSWTWRCEHGLDYAIALIRGNFTPSLSHSVGHTQFSLQ